MDLGSIFLILALLVVVGLFVARPLYERGAASASQSVPENHELSAMLAERDRILNALQELDFDHALGKIPAEDFPAQRAALLQRGADILRRLDSLQAQQGADNAEDRIEAQIAARRADAARPAGTAPHARLSNPDDELEALLANRRRERQEKSAGFCPKCGGPVQKSDRFCPKCGGTL